VDPSSSSSLFQCEVIALNTKDQRGGSVVRIYLFPDARRPILAAEVSAYDSMAAAAVIGVMAD